jgi:antitoxin HicB
VGEREYEIVLRPEPEGGFSVFVPELPSVVTEGATVQLAHAMAREAIEGYLEVMHEHGLAVPAVRRGRVAVRTA